jgi:hypothetical protein
MVVFGILGSIDGSFFSGEYVVRVSRTASENSFSRYCSRQLFCHTGIGRECKVPKDSHRSHSDAPCATDRSKIRDPGCMPYNCGPRESFSPRNRNAAPHRVGRQRQKRFAPIYPRRIWLLLYLYTTVQDLCSVHIALCLDYRLMSMFFFFFFLCACFRLSDTFSMDMSLGNRRLDCWTREIVTCMIRLVWWHIDIAEPEFLIGF